VADEATLDLLSAYAEAGGHLVLGFRPGYADLEARPRVTVQPGKLRRTAGLSYDEFSTLQGPLRVRAADGAGFTLEEGAHATRWADGLVPEGARPLVEYDHPHFGRWPAAATHEVGPGRVTYVGTLPDPALARSIARAIAPPSRTQDPWRADLPPSVTVMGARIRDGHLRVVHNWSWEPAQIAVPGAATDLLSGHALGAGERLSLSAWDVRVLVERTRPVRDLADPSQEVTP
jgi:beta-galactosidase